MYVDIAGGVDNRLVALAMALGGALVLAGGHLFAGRLRFMRKTPRSWWLSVAGGASVAYVFVHVFPELGEGQADFEERGWLAGRFLEHHVYLIALLGFGAFYGLERLVQRSRQKRMNANSTAADTTSVKHGEAPPPSRGVFWLHITSFGIYNLIVGYLLVHRDVEGPWSLLVFTLAMGLHFLVNDYGLHDHHQGMYTRTGRWVLCGAVLAGWGVGTLTRIHPAAMITLFAFLAGGVVLNVIKEELPEERQSRFWAFAIGGVTYAGLLLFA